ncbi:MAG: hypothetical protein LBU38_07925 [Propionibacteriaceae bacterium]|jgi:hypothetical protein|nr:hypothetical protein [Propionibacteriaceae bacterium]
MSLFFSLNSVMVTILMDMVVGFDDVALSAINVAAAHWNDCQDNADQLLQMKEAIWRHVEASDAAKAGDSSKRAYALKAILCVLDPAPGEVVQDDGWEDLFEPDEEQYYCSTVADFFCRCLKLAPGSVR